jgi:4-hydroxy-tetrahydrodipicolinate reductase
MSQSRIAISGALGRMGQSIAKLLLESGDRPYLALESPHFAADSIDLMARLGVAGQSLFIETHLNDSQASTFDVLIDFTHPNALLDKIEFCVKYKKALVVGTTGLNQQQEDALKKASQFIPIVYAPNMSMGVNLLFKLLEVAAKALGDEADIEIIEAHHRLKKDSPSGTALGMGKVIAEALGRDLSACAVYGREGQVGERPDKEIGFATIRGGDIIGDHTALFALMGERIEISHKATDRINFARGAIRAARWVFDRPAGLYDMIEVLGL